jgi:vacuolar-type H+-ATPase subunit C/Vma6
MEAHMPWDDLNARVRGLASHLLGRAAIEELALEPDTDALLRRLRDGPYDVNLRGSVASASAIDLSVRRAAAARLAIIAKWAGPRARQLRILFEDEDRRSLRALLRGAVGGARPEARLAGLVPTPELPERALEELARLTTAAQVAALLVAWGNAYGSALLEAASASQPDLFAIELTLTRTFAQRARRSARGRALITFVRDAIDCENAAAAAALAGRRTNSPPEAAFLEGGRRIRLEDYLFAARAQDADVAIGRLARVGGGRSWFAQALLTASPATLEKALLRWRALRQRKLARISPLGPALVLSWALRLRAEVMDLRTITWGLALRAPRLLVQEELVTP